jgi:carboxymethylenebutenolidase
MTALQSSAYYPRIAFNGGASMRWLAICLAFGLALAAGSAAGDLAPWTRSEFPQDKEKWWWDPDWWERGRMPRAENHAVSVREASYRSGDAEVPVRIYRPQGAGRFPVIVFMHGRRGVDELTQRIPLRLAARGFTVVGPDFYTARLIDKYPIGHDRAIEDDAARAITFALSLPEAKQQTKICVASHTRGGYYSLRALVTKKMQSRTACYVAWYPHWQDPNAPEPMQVYQYAPEVDALTVPVLVFFGEHEQYQRYRPILTGIESLQAKKRDARVIVYPGVGRGFDFRPPSVRTFADDLATQDSLRRAAVFMRRALAAD